MTEEQQLENLREIAIARYLDKTDWDISEWLTPEEWAKYSRLSEN